VGLSQTSLAGATGLQTTAQPAAVSAPTQVDVGLPPPAPVSLPAVTHGSANPSSAPASGAAADVLFTDLAAGV
jgi:hypothetical protein